jgi:hypothetical protein
MHTMALEKEIIKARDFQEIQNLQAKYGYLFQRGPWADWENEMCNLFTHDATIEIEDSGVFIGWSGVKKVFGKDGLVCGSRKPSDLFVFMQLQPYIKVYDDGTAAALWTCLGFIGSTPNNNVPEISNPSAIWIAGRYEMEYKKIGNEWKICKLIFRQYFRSPYEVGWCLPQGTKAVNPSITMPDLPTTIHRPYDPKANHKEEQMPDPVLPPDKK